MPNPQNSRHNTSIAVHDPATDDNAPPTRILHDTEVVIDGDNHVLNSSQGAPSLLEFANQTSRRLDSLLGGRAARRTIWISPLTHQEALDAFSQAGFTVRVCPPLTRGGKTASTDHALIAETMSSIFRLQPRLLYIVSSDTDYAHLARVATDHGTQVHILSPNHRIPEALSAAALSAEPLWSTETPREAPKDEKPTSKTHEPSGLNQTNQGPIASKATPVRATAGAPSAVYRSIILPLHRLGIAIPAIDTARLRDALRFAGDTLSGPRDAFHELQRICKDQAIGLRSAEVGFILSAITDGRRYLHMKGNAQPTDADAFVEGIWSIAQTAGLDLPKASRRNMTTWAGATESAPGTDRARVAESMAEVA